MVYFPSNVDYSFGSVTVPAEVVRIEKLEGTMVLSEPSLEPLVIADAQYVTIDNRTNRTVILYSSAGWGEVKNNGTKQDWHLCNVGQIYIHNLTNSSVWSRWINAEYVTSKLTVAIGFKWGTNLNGSRNQEFK